MLCYVMFVTLQSVTTYYPALHSLALWSVPFTLRYVTLLYVVLLVLFNATLCCITLHNVTSSYITLHDVSVAVLYTPLRCIVLLCPTLTYAMLCSLHYNMLYSLTICSVTLPPCLASCYITLSNLALSGAFQTPPSQTFPLTTNPALQTDPCCCQTPLAFGFQRGCSKNTTAAAIDQIKRKLDYRVLLHTHDVLFLPSVLPQVPIPVDAICQLCKPAKTHVFDLSGHAGSQNLKSDRKGVWEQCVPLFCLPCRGPQLLIIDPMAGQFFGKDLAAAPWPFVMQPLFGGESRLWEHKRSKAFKSLAFSQWTPDSWGRIGPGLIRSRCSLLLIATSNASACSGFFNEAHGCQEIGHVTFTFFFELLFSYVFLAISFYVSLTNLFLITLSLIWSLPETLKTKEKPDFDSTNTG